MPTETIERRILFLRGRRVMLDSDLAELYGVTTKALNKAVKRNRNRFPKDFMFRLNGAETRAISNLRSQFATSNAATDVMRSRFVTASKRNIRHLPHAFTEHGAVMLANTLKSSRAVHTSIQVVRAFIRLRQILLTNESLARKIDSLEKRIGKHDSALQNILFMIQKLLEQPPAESGRGMGFSANRKP